MYTIMSIDVRWADVLLDIPHDAPAIFTYLLLAVFVGFVWIGSRNKGDPGDPPGNGPETPERKED